MNRRSIPARVIDLHRRAGRKAAWQLYVRIRHLGQTPDQAFAGLAEYLAERCACVCRERQVLEPWVQRECAAHAWTTFASHSQHLILGLQVGGFGKAERMRLANRRPSALLAMKHGSARYTVGIGYYDDGRPGEVFIDSPKVGSEAAALAHDVAVLISIAVQFRVPLAVMRGAVGRAGATPESAPHSVAGAVLDLLSKEAENA